MARIVKELPKVKRGRPEVYPYSQLFNGKKWEMQQGEDFHVSAASFKAAIYAMKTKLGYTVITREVKDPNTGLSKVTVQRLTGAVAKAHNAKRAARKAS